MDHFSYKLYDIIRSISTGSPPNEKENLKMEISNAYQPLLYKETQEKDNLQSLLTGKDWV